MEIKWKDRILNVQEVGLIKKNHVYDSLAKNPWFQTPLFNNSYTDSVIFLFWTYFCINSTRDRLSLALTPSFWLNLCVLTSNSPCLLPSKLPLYSYMLFGGFRFSFLAALLYLGVLSYPHVLGVERFVLLLPIIKSLFYCMLLCCTWQKPQFSQRYLWQHCIQQARLCHFFSSICSLWVSISHSGESHNILSFFCFDYSCYGDLWSVIFDVTILIFLGDRPRPRPAHMANFMNKCVRSECSTLLSSLSLSSGSTVPWATAALELGQLIPSNGF